MELKRLLAILSLLLTIAFNTPAHGAPEAEEAAAPAPLLDFHLRETSVVRAMRNVLEALRDSLMSQSREDGDLEISSLLDSARKQLGSPNLRGMPSGAASLESLTQELVDFVKDVAVQEVALEAFRQVFTDAALAGIEDPVEAEQASATIEMGQVLQKIQDRLKAGGFPEKLVREALPAISGCGLRFDQATAAAAEASANSRSLQQLTVAVPLLLEEEVSSRGEEDKAQAATAQGQSSEPGEASSGSRGLQEQLGPSGSLLLKEETASGSAAAEEQGAASARAPGDADSESSSSASARRLAVVESLIDAAVGRPGYGGNYGPNYGYGYRPYDRYGGGRRPGYSDYGPRPYDDHHHHHHHDPYPHYPQGGGRGPYPGGRGGRY